MLCDDEGVAARDEADDDAALLRRRRCSHSLDARSLSAHDPRLSPRLANAVTGALDPRCDRLVLPSDATE